MDHLPNQFVHHSRGNYLSIRWNIPSIIAGKNFSLKSLKIKLRGFLLVYKFCKAKPSRWFRHRRQKSLKSNPNKFFFANGFMALLSGSAFKFLAQNWNIKRREHNNEASRCLQRKQTALYMCAVSNAPFRVKRHN